MSEKLRILTDKIYNEGIEKAKLESEQLVEKAKAEAKAIISEAEKYKDKLIADTNQELNNQRKKVEADIKLAAQKAVNQLKINIQNLITEQVITQPVKEVLNKPEMLFELMNTCMQSLKNNGDGQFQISINQAIHDKISQTLNQLKHNELQSNLQVSIANQNNVGFEITPTATNYSLKFTDETFINFFNTFLKLETQNLVNS